MIVYGITIP